MSDALTVSVSGQLTLATSGGWFQKIVAQGTAHGQVLRIDLSGVTEVDSSALAFITSVHRVMAQKGCQIEWQQIPDTLRNVAHIYDADKIFVPMMV